jgi:hypothetical protein
MAKPKIKKVQMNVRIPEELMRRVSAVSGSRGQSLADWVASVLDLRTKGQRLGVEEMKKHDEDVQQKQSKIEP